ncbi:hypothetical protein [Shewanella baltica]|uniref:hypothetical protein n=1 Tax=Shewanella baltica TaxID=62322 RepID=UPI00217D4B6C|nr:hypothetical protein [Shewanella baltica]MCS6162401.1 hypothetical protein [Shewanella baltica]
MGLPQLIEKSQRDWLFRVTKLNILKNAGVESPSVLSGRRAFAVELHRQGYDVAHIHYLLGNKTLETTQKLLTTDPISMGAIAANAF